MASVFTEHATGARTYTRADGTVAEYARERRARLIMHLTLPNRTRRRIAVQFPTEHAASRLLASARALEDLTRNTRALSPELLAPFERQGLISPRTHVLLTGSARRASVDTWDDAERSYLERTATGRDADTPKNHLSRTKAAATLLRRIRARWATPADVTEADVSAYLDERTAEGKSFSTVNRDLFTLRHLLHEAGLHVADDSQLSRKQEWYEELPRALTPEQDHALLHAAFEERRLLGGDAFGVYLVCRFFGLRPSEAQYLTWDDVQADGLAFGKKKLHQGETHESWSDGHYHTKTKSRRIIRPPHAAEVIAILRARVPVRGRFVFGVVDPETGVQRVHKDLPKAVKKLLDRSAPPVEVRRKGMPQVRGVRRKLEGLGAYALRHTFATWMLRRTRNGKPYEQADLVTLMRWMGHVNPRTTMYYEHGEYQEGAPTILEALRGLAAPSASKVVAFRRPGPGRPAA